MPLIVLWDIDHTLIENAGVSKEIYAAAFTSLASRPPLRPARTEGRTDRLIIADMFTDHGLEPPGWAKTEAALTAAGEASRDELSRRGQVLPGAHQALKAVAGEGGMISSVLTGNIEANARVKLGAFGLDAWLDLAVGAYGADSSDRAELPDVARRRAAAAYGIPDETPVVLIGDTPRDVDAALRSGSQVIAVASGVDSVEDLRAAGAHLVLPDLTGLGDLVRCLRTLARL